MLIVIKIKRGRTVEEDGTQQHPFELYFSIYELWFFLKKKNKKQSLDLKTHFSKMTKVLRMCGAWACEDGGNR